jgi:hypothetical protein
MTKTMIVCSLTYLDISPKNFYSLVIYGFGKLINYSIAPGSGGGCVPEDRIIARFSCAGLKAAEAERPRISAIYLSAVLDFEILTKSGDELCGKQRGSIRARERESVCVFQGLVMNGR